jgi:hypothetical protein
MYANTCMNFSTSILSFVPDREPKDTIMNPLVAESIIFTNGSAKCLASLNDTPGTWITAGIVGLGKSVRKSLSSKCIKDCSSIGISDVILCVYFPNCGKLSSCVLYVNMSF